MPGPNELTNIRLYLPDGELPSPIRGDEAGAMYFVKKQDKLLDIVPPCVATGVLNSFARITGTVSNGSVELIIWEEVVGGQNKVRCEIAELNAGNLDRTIVDMSALDALNKSTLTDRKAFWDANNSQFVFLARNTTDSVNEIYKIDPSGTPSASKTATSGVLYISGGSDGRQSFVKTVAGTSYLYETRGKLFRFNIDTGAGAEVVNSDTNNNIVHMALQNDGDVFTAYFQTGSFVRKWYVFDPDTNSFGAGVANVDIPVVINSSLHEMTAGIFVGTSTFTLPSNDDDAIFTFDDAGNVIDTYEVRDSQSSNDTIGGPISLTKISSTQVLLKSNDSTLISSGSRFWLFDIDGSGNISLNTKGPRITTLDNQSFGDERHTDVNVSGGYFLSGTNQPSAEGLRMFDLASVLESSDTVDSFALLDSSEVPLNDLPLHGLYATVYLLGPGNSAGMHPVNILLSNAVGGKWDGGLPARNVRLLLDDPGEPGGGFAYKINANIPVTDLSASCVLEGPGKMLVLGEIFKD